MERAIGVRRQLEGAGGTSCEHLARGSMRRETNQGSTVFWNELTEEEILPLQWIAAETLFTGTFAPVSVVVKVVGFISHHCQCPS